MVLKKSLFNDFSMFSYGKKSIIQKRTKFTTFHLSGFT